VPSLDTVADELLTQNWDTPREHFETTLAKTLVFLRSIRSLNKNARAAEWGSASARAFEGAPMT
jgi:hypothetical protein